MTPLGVATHTLRTAGLECAERKGIGKLNSETLAYSSNGLFEKVALDIAGPLNKTRKNNIYLLSIIDVLSRFVVLVPLKILNRKLLSMISNATGFLFLDYQDFKF